jgi:hypothetical protein
MKVELLVAVIVFAVVFCGVNIFCVSRVSLFLPTIASSSQEEGYNDGNSSRINNNKTTSSSTTTTTSDTASYLKNSTKSTVSEPQQPQEGRQRPTIQTTTTTTTSSDKSHDDRVYWRYDEAGRFDHVTVSRSHWLPSIPATRMIPVEQAENITYHLRQRTNITGKSTLRLVPGTKGKYRVVDPMYDKTQDYRTLYLYNPSVAPLLSYNDDDADNDPLGIRESFGADAVAIAYVATFRAYLGSNCFGSDKDRLLMKAGEQVNYLGIALLDASLNILHDAVIDLNAGPLPNGETNTKPSMMYWSMANQPAEDCRIFNVGGTSLTLICNAIHFQIQLRKKAAAAADAAMTPPAGTEDSGAAPPPATTVLFPHVYPNMYGDTLQVILLVPPSILIHGKDSKNMNVFYHETSGIHYLQVYPHPHWYQPLFNTANVATVRAPDDHRAMVPPSSSFDTPDVHHPIRASLKDLGRGSNQTVDDQPFFAKTGQDRGTACCVTVRYKGDNVRVGISHVKLHRRQSDWTKDQLQRYENVTYTYGWNRYLSRFLAYEMEPPFAVLAVSGWFCLGFGGTEQVDDEQHNQGNPLAGRNTQYQLDLFDEAYDCPAIHFASGIAETVDDPTKAIIAYGVNDCYPRMIVVDKKDIEKKLDPHMDAS